MFSYKSKVSHLSLLFILTSAQVSALNLFSDIRKTEVPMTAPKGVVAKEFTGDMIYDGFVALSSRNSVGQLQFINNAFRLIENPETAIDTMRTVPISSSPLSLAMTDLDNDRDLDLLVTTDNDSSLLWLRNDGFTNGKMNLTLRNNFVTSSNSPKNMTLVDLNGDLHEDILLATGGLGFTRLMNSGDGNITLRLESSGNTPISSATGDFNGDGHVDVAVTNSGSNNVSILFGASDGSGSLTRDANYPADASLTQAWGIQSADVNGDSHLDLIVTSRGANTLTVLAGDAMGHFSVLSSTPTCQQPTNLVLGDFNHDAHTDAAVICVGDGKLRILVGDGVGHFNVSPAQPDITLGSNPYDIVKGDFNHDGKDDLLVSVTGENKLVTLLGNTPPTFRDGSFDAATGTFSVTYVDADGDLPSSMKIRIGETGEFVDMQEVSATEHDTTSGKRYQYRPSSLSAGTYAYFFQTSDGLHSLTFRNESSASLAQDIVPARSGGCSLNGKASSYSVFLFSSLVFMGWVRRRKIGCN